VVSSKVFARLDNYMWALTYKWARYSHPNKPNSWAARYFGPFNRFRRNRWVFGDRHSGAYLPKFAWTRIVRHQMVPGTASPDDPTLADYWARRRRRRSPPLDGLSLLRLLQAQHGRCPACGGLLLHAEHEPTGLPKWEQWLTVTRKAVRKKAIIAEREPGTPDDPAVLRLLHALCQQPRTAVAVSVPGRACSP
jgi:RNA-directed DNA polymerase